MVSDMRNERLAIYDGDGEPVEMKIELEAAN